MSIFLKNILSFLFRKPLNGMIFAEREREREHISKDFFQNIIISGVLFCTMLRIFL